MDVATLCWWCGLWGLGLGSAWRNSKLIITYNGLNFCENKISQNIADDCACMDQESGYQWVAVRSVMISFSLFINLPQVWWPRGARITHLSERCRWLNNSNFNSLYNNFKVGQININCELGFYLFQALLALSFVVGMVTDLETCMHKTPMDILALFVMITGE